MNSYVENHRAKNFGNGKSKDSNKIKTIIHYVNFPKKYQRKWTNFIDTRFGIIWLLTFIFHFSFALYFTLHSPTGKFSITEINRIQEKYAELLLKSAPEVKKDVIENQLEEGSFVSLNEIDFTENQNEIESVGEGTATVKFSEEQKEETSPAESRIKKYFSGNMTSRRPNTKISEEVNSIGLLALLGNESDNTKGEIADELLREAAGRQKKFKKVLGNVSGIQSSDNSQSGGTGRSASRKTKGSRTQSNEDIKGLISDREQAVTSDVKRQSSFVTEKVTVIKDDKNNVVGNRDPNEISVVINRHNAAIQSCYDRGLKRDPDLKGKLVVRFTITINGRAKDVKLLSSTLNNPRAERCIVGKIRRWDDFGQIDSALGKATVRQVYTFGY